MVMMTDFYEEFYNIVA